MAIYIALGYRSFSSSLPREARLDFDRGNAKWDEDEKGMVGSAMWGESRMFGFAMAYKLSEEYIQWAKGGGFRLA